MVKSTNKYMGCRMREYNPVVTRSDAFGEIEKDLPNWMRDSTAKEKLTVASKIPTIFDASIVLRHALGSRYRSRVELRLILRCASLIRKLTDPDEFVNGFR